MRPGPHNSGPPRSHRRSAPLADARTPPGRRPERVPLSCTPAYAYLKRARSARAPLGEEGAHRGTKFLRLQLDGENARLRLDSRTDLLRVTAQQAPGGEQRAVGLPCQCPRQRARLGKQHGLLDHAVHQAEPLRGGGIERLAEQQQLGRPLLTHQPRQQQRAGRFRHQTEGDERHRQLRAARRDNQVAVQQQRHADADGLPVDSGQQRLLERRQGVQEAHHGVLGAEGRAGEEIVEVVAGAEAGALTREQYRPYRRVRLRLAQAPVQRLVHGEGDGVALLGTIEAHLAHPSGARNEDLIAHGCGGGALWVRKSTSLSAASHTSAAQAATFWSSCSSSTLSRVSSAVWWMSKYALASWLRTNAGTPAATDGPTSVPASSGARGAASTPMGPSTRSAVFANSPCNTAGGSPRR